jgi:peptidoglycan/LPS O-acetylase OafA/YrhL
MQQTDLGIAFGLGLLWQALVWFLNRRQKAISFASIRTWVLFLLSGLAVYWLQPAMPIRSLDFWLPTATLGLTALGWALTAAPEQRSLRQVLPGGLALLGLVLLVGLTRYLGLTGWITATRPPQTPFIGLALLVLAALFVSLIRWPRKALLGVGILLLIALLVVL